MYILPFLYLIQALCLVAIVGIGAFLAAYALAWALLNLQREHNRRG